MSNRWVGASLSELLKQTKVSSIPHKPVVIISSSETPTQGFEKLLNHNIQSAPVFDEATKKFIGFLDIRDLISHTVFAFQNRDKVAYISGSPVNHIVHAFNLVENVTTSYLARRNPFHEVSEEASLWDVAVLLAKGAHRVPIVDSKGALVSIISQSNLIKLFAANLNTTLKEETNVKIRDLEVGTSPVLSVSKDTAAIETFIKLDNAKKTGLAILDTNGTLLGNISGKDLKLYVKSNCSYDVLDMSVLQFLSKVRAENIDDIMAPSISCNLDETLAAVIGKLAATGVHRIFIVNSSQDYTPARIISLTDVLRCVLLLDVPSHSIK